MCSLNWRKFDNHISIAFNRDESVLREKAELPQIFNDNYCQFIMPRDPAGNGSWLAANEYGFVFLLLNDYQGQLKNTELELQSRGMLIRELASCRSFFDVKQYISTIDLTKLQPFHLFMINQEQPLCWHYDGIKSILSSTAAPQQKYSSGHTQGADIVKLRTDYITSLNIQSEQGLINAHQDHKPVTNNIKVTEQGEGSVDLSYALCMHREEAKTQSLTYITLTKDKVTMKYWDGQPCTTDHVHCLELALI